MNLHEKILSYCFEDDGIYRHVKLNNEPIDCSDLTITKSELDHLFENLIDRVQSGKDICYDTYANCLMDMYHFTNLIANPLHVYQYVQILLELEATVPFKLVSTSLIHCLLLLMEYEEVEAEYWFNLYENGPSQLKHIFACGIFKSAGFDEDFYGEICEKVNYKQLFAMMHEAKIIPDIVSIHDLMMINGSFPANIQAKIRLETQSAPAFKTVVYN